MKEERTAILGLVKEGKLSVEEAERLLDAMDQDAGKPVQVSELKFIRVDIKDKDSTKVKVNLPVSLAKALWRFIPKEHMDKLKDQDIDLETVLESVAQGASGNLVDIESDDGTKVRVFVE